MDKKEILDILDNAKDDRGAVPMRLVRQALDKLSAIQPISSVQPKPDCVSRQAAIDAVDVLCQEHRYRIPGKRETYSQYNEAWQDALDRAEVAIGNLPSAQPEIIRCKDCKHRDKYGCCKYWKGLAMGDIPIATDDYDFCSYAKRI